MLHCSPELHQKYAGQNVSHKAIGSPLLPSKTTRNPLHLHMCAGQISYLMRLEDMRNLYVRALTAEEEEACAGVANTPNQCVRPCLASCKLNPDCAHLF